MYPPIFFVIQTSVFANQTSILWSVNEIGNFISFLADELL